MVINHKQLQKEMGDAQMLIPEQEALLIWMTKQTSPVSIADMIAANAPGYDRNRVKDLALSGYLRKTTKYENGILSEAYLISDAGKCALAALNQERQNAAERKAEKQAENAFQKRVAIQSAVIGAVAGAVAGILASEISDLIPDIIKSIFHL